MHTSQVLSLHMHPLPTATLWSPKEGNTEGPGNTSASSTLTYLHPLKDCLWQQFQTEAHQSHLHANQGFNAQYPHPSQQSTTLTIEQPQATFPNHLKQDVLLLQDLPSLYNAPLPHPSTIFSKHHSQSIPHPHSYDQ